MINMANTQWKSYQPPVPDPAILAFQRAPAPKQSTASTNISKTTVPSSISEMIRPAAVKPTAAPSIGPPTGSIRETGIIDKLQHSYGFIQCCERDTRLFFHFSEYSGSLDNITVGESVEFQMSFDRRTGKPIAVAVVKMTDGSATFELINEKRVNGTVVVEAKPAKNKIGSPLNPLMQEGVGRVSYEECGECFFIPYSVDDVENGAKIRQNDIVSFRVCTNKRNGSVRAIEVRLVTARQPERCQGVVCSLKDGYGFIERADVVKEIFFHYSEYEGDVGTCILGEDVEFTVQTRNGKDVAVDIKKLAEGTVIFEDVGVECRRGRIIKTLKSARGRKTSDPLAGRIVYETLKGSIEIPYGDKDQRGDYTLQSGDLVDFYIATDRRDKLQRATNIQLVDDTFKISGEKRETGLVCSIKDGFGFIRCVEREARMFFHFSELMTLEREVAINDELQFTVVQDPTSPSRQIAVRIAHLPRGTISLETVLPDKHIGTVEKLATATKSPSKKDKDKDQDPGIIMYDVNGTKQTIPFSVSVIQGAPPKISDKVEFQICESRRNNTKTAVNVRTVLSMAPPRSPSKPSSVTSVKTSQVAASSAQAQGDSKDVRATPTASPNDTLFRGYVATLKDSFGFIETLQHDKEVFFHFSNFEGDAVNELDLGDEVEYTLAKKTNKVSAEWIRKLPTSVRGSVAPDEEVLPSLLDGRVLRSLRIVNPDQDEYAGLVQVVLADGSMGEKYEYGITSLTDKRDFLQTGDVVKFKVAVTRGSGKRRASNITAVRKYIRSKVESLKGPYGFLHYEAVEGKKLFFHMSELHGGGDLSPGDEVEFVVVQNQRNNKFSAVSLRKITDRRRPERLMSRLKSTPDDGTPRLTVIRQPRGPDGSKGFAQPRKPWQPLNEPARPIGRISSAPEVFSV